MSFAPHVVPKPGMDSYSSPVLGIRTFGSKLAYSAAFVFIRADEYHKTLTDVLRKAGLYSAVNHICARLTLARNSGQPEPCCP